jgi:hypothetical protein
VNILGIIASSKLSAVGDYESIATVTVGGGGAASVTFSSIPGTFTHLQLRMFVQETRADYGIAGARMTFNSDGGSNYAYHQVNGNGSSADAGANTSVSFIRINDGSFGTNQGPGGLTFGASVLDILDYANTNKYKTTRALAGVDINGTVLSVGGRVGLFSGLWQSTSAVTSFSITPDGATDFREYSQFALYGIKAA